LQQHLSNSFLPSLQNNFPFFCCSQQHFLIALPVNVHVIFGEAAKPTPAIATWLLIETKWSLLSKSESAATAL
jgi:hypothetical protein